MGKDSADVLRLDPDQVRDAAQYLDRLARPSESFTPVSGQAAGMGAPGAAALSELNAALERASQQTEGLRWLATDTASGLLELLAGAVRADESFVAAAATLRRTPQPGRP